MSVSTASRTLKIKTTVSVKSPDDLNQRLITSDSLKILSVKALKKNEEKSKGKVEKTYADLLTELKGTGKLWEDPDFPADSSSVFNSTKSKNYRQFDWKRPKDITSQPKLFTGGASRFDVQQGALGDCWLLAVVASLSMYEPIFKNVVPDDQDFDSNYIGAFRFRFWRFGKWVEVIVDDRIPTVRGRLVYMHSSESSEFWTALLEKAYAKICGGYEALNGGSQSEAMEDFTGGLCETINLTQKERPADLFNQMKKFVAQSTLMGCAIESKNIEGVLTNGLITGHAYSVTGITQLTQTSGNVESLVRIRNPWGNEKEWKGKWSDNSQEWNSISVIDKKNYSNFNSDGEFWMSYQDFVDNFTKLEVCHLGPESLDSNLDGKRRWEESLEDGAWSKNVNAGGCRNFLDSFITNPQYRVEVVDPDIDDKEDTGTVIVGLMQKDMRQRHLDFYVIGYVIYKLKDPQCGILDKSFFKFNTSIAKSPNFSNQREICGRHKLPVGHYVIIPSTFNPNEEANYILRIFTQKPNNTKALDVNSGRIAIAKHLETRTNSAKMDQLEKELEVIFNKISGPSEVIDAGQLRTILNAVMAKDTQCIKMKNFDGFNFEICRSMVALYDDNHTGKMEFLEFLKLFKNLRIWKTAFRDFDADDNGQFDSVEFRNALNNCGLSVSNSLFKVLANRYSDPEKGVITFEDFLMALIRLTNSFETTELQTRDATKRLVFTADEFMESLLYM